MRGKADQKVEMLSQVRITPAYAGKSSGLFTAWLQCKDHPRLCGEKYNVTQEKRLVTGSPPPMRGKGRLGHEAYSCDRITPAYAGKSARVRTAKYWIKDHPRLCGEKRAFRLVQRWNVGSPPPMRGKENGVLHMDNRIRITPAYAGKRVGHDRKFARE